MILSVYSGANKKMKILITGGTGFVGSKVVEKLAIAANSVLVLSRTRREKNNNVAYIGRDEIYQVFEKGLDVVIHIATEYGRGDNSPSTEATNYDLPSYLLKLSEIFDVKLFLNTDSFYVRHKHTFHHMDEYIKTKEMFKKKLFDGTYSGVKRINVVLSHVCGVGDKSEKFLPWVIDEICKGNKVRLSECFQELDIIDVDDVSEAYFVIISSMGTIRDKDEYEVGTGCVIQLRVVIEKLLALIQTKINVNKNNLLFGKNQAGNIEGTFRADTNNIRSLGWKSRKVIDDSLLEMVTERLGKLD